MMVSGVFKSLKGTTRTSPQSALC